VGLFDKKKYLFEKANPSPPTLNLEGLTNVYLPTWQHEDPCSRVRCLPWNVTIMAMTVSHRTDTWKYKQTWSRKSLTLKSYVQTPTMGTKGNQEQILKPIFLTILVQTYCGLFRLFETIIIIIIIIIDNSGCPDQLTGTTTIPQTHWKPCKPRRQVRHRGGDRRAR